MNIEVRRVAPFQFYHCKNNKGYFSLFEIAFIILFHLLVLVIYQQHLLF